MDPPGRVPRRTQDEWDDRGRRRSEWAINLPGSDDRRDGSEGAEQSTRPRQHSITSGHLPRQVSASSTRQKGSQPESRLEDRRGLAQRLHIFPYRPHSSNASRNSSANTSSSSLPSLGENSAAEGNESTSYFGTSPSHNMHASRASESSHMPPLSPLSEHPPLTTTVSGRSGDYPVYPNQSYAVLQNQVYPPPHQPLLRTRSSYPSHHSLSAGPTAPSWYSRDPSSRPQGARTAGNTPISSPGLFSTHRPNSPSIGSDDFRVSYLHPTHLQEPKETHTVEVDRDMLTGNKLINEYEILDELGRGEHGKVKLGRHLRTGQKVAIKIVQRYSKRRRLGKLGNPEDKVKKEVAILKKARHPNVVSLLEVIDDPNRQKVYIVLEFVENGEILWRRKGLKEIVTVDKRRLEREKRGIPDSASFIEESQQFVRASQLRRQRRDRARKKKMSAMSHYSGVPAWSLEHGGESDDDVDPEFASLHPTSTSTTVVDAPVAHITPNHSFTSASDFESRMREYAMEAMEGSMYGPYAAESLDRRYSTASSNLGYQTSEADWQSDDDDLSYVPCLTLAEARSAFRDAVLGLEYLHYQGIIHRDIKPANLLVTATSRVKISDFGVSYLGRPLREEDEEQVTETDATELDDARELSKTVGTPAFYAPELCYTGTEFETTIGRVPKITGAIDVWSLGVTLYGMIFGRLPFVSDDEFGLFQHIVKHSVFIPTRRLKAVEPPPPPGAGSMPRVMNSNKRMEDELVYEDIDDELCDLLSRLLVKDPTKRITLKEIKYHPWVLRDIPDPKAWVEETDPGYQSKGKRIEVSNDEVTRAVTKMPFIERVRSNVARWGGNIFSRSRDSRRRAPSSANSGETLNSASSTSSVTIGRDLIREIRRASLRGDEEVNSRTPKSGKDGEHPLSQSVLASPEIKDDSSYFGSDGASKGDSASSDHPTRPELPERATPVFSSTTSSKTVRPSGPSATVSSDLAKKGGSSSASSGLGGIFSGAGLRLARGLHTGEWRRERSRSTDRSVDGDGHSGPSVAISSASATGQVQSPDVLRNPSSTSLVSTNSQNSTTTGNPPSPRRRNRSQTLGHKSSAESLQYIRDPLQRQRRQQQDYFQNARPAPSEREREIYSSDRRHPRDHQNQTDGSSAIEYNRAREPSDPQDPITSPPSAVTMSSSSADDFTSGMSHSASHPSIPSVVSGASSLSADGFHSSCLHEREQKDVDASGHVPPLLRTGDTVKARPMHHDERAHEDESKYDCDDEDEYESEDEGIVFGKKTSSCSGGPTRV